MEGAREFQDRVLRGAGRRLGRASAGGVRRSADGHKFCSMLPAFTMEARPVVPVMDAVRAELEVMAWRDKITAK